MIKEKLDADRLIYDSEYRLNNLYHIVDKSGNDIKFNLNYVQNDVLKNLHTRNLILKARQLGMSTFSVLYLMDYCIWNPNTSAGIVSYSLEHAQHIFKRIIGYALDHLPNWLRVPIIGRSAREISFANGSVLRVDTTLRGGAYQLVLVSEFGKTCARNPQKAEEVVTGTLQAVPYNGKIIIESTGEGTDGYFAEMVNNAVQRGNENLSDLEYKLFFYNWTTEPTYQINEKIYYEGFEAEYFDTIEKQLNIKLNEKQKYWYTLQRKILGDKIRQEFPSTVGEAFLSNSDAYYFSQAISKCYEDRRCVNSNIYDALFPVYVAMDIGINDLTVIIFFQIIHGEIRIIDYYEDKNKDCDFYAKFLLQDKKYLYHTIFLPHDSRKRDILDITNTFERDFRKLFSGTSTRFHVLKRIDKQVSISHARIKIDRCVFNIQKVKPLVDQLSKYRKKWIESIGRYSEEPLHNVSCFIGETLIDTDKGKVRIDKIKVGDKVLTPNGFKVVDNVFKYKCKKIFKVQQDKLKVFCTHSHQFFTKKGLVNADSLCYSNQLLTINEIDICHKIASLGKERNLGFKDFFLSMSQEQLSTLTDLSIQRINSVTGWEGIYKTQAQETCIEQFGFTTIMKYLLDMTSTISMEINQTIRLKISKLFPIPLTCQCTCPQTKERNYQEKVLEKQLNAQKNGIVLKREENGIVNMQKNHLKKGNMFKKFVCAVKNVILRFKNGLNTVHQIVNQNTEENQALIMKKDHVKFVSKNMNAINIVKKKHVLKVVEQCLDTEKEVYDLTVRDDHCYFANGFLVSNSNYSDAFQYVCQAVTHIEAVGNLNGAMEQHKKLVENRHRILW